MSEIALLQEQLARYCAKKLPEARKISVTGLERISGGASRETWRFVLHGMLGRQRKEARLILRRDPGSSLIETERRIEFGAYQAFAGSPVPVPRVLWLEEDAKHLGHPFFVMEEITGCEAGPLKLMEQPYRAGHRALAEQKWTILGEIAKAPIGALAHLLAPVEVSQAAARELNYWHQIIERDALEPQPIAAAAIRFLRANPPPPAQRISLIHGDFRTGNFLVDPQARIRAVLDWEMLHLGDPLEDLAWGMNRAWRFQNDDRVGGLATQDDAIAWWEASSGLHCDRRALHWWELFTCIKSQAIWISAARNFESGDNRDMLMGVAAWMLINTEDRAMLDLMGKLR